MKRAKIIMELEQIHNDLAMKSLVAEVRFVSGDPQAAKEQLVHPDVATGVGAEAGDVGGLRLNELRTDAIYRAARTYATRAGLSWRYDQINEVLLARQGALDAAVSFAPFIEKGMILIPSVMESRAEQELKDGVLTRINASFYVDQEAELVTQPPTFRDYLVREYPKPDDVHAVLKPKTKHEQAMWDKGRDDGWQLGVDQADEIFIDGFNEMEQDIIGRITYLKLKSLNMIGAAQLEVTEAGITFNGRAMNAGEVLYRITSPALYQSMNNWTTAWSLPATEGDQ